MKSKFNFAPLILLGIMILSVVTSFVFKDWFSMFIASEMILFHFVPPLLIPVSIIAYKKKLGFWYKQFSWEKSFYKKIHLKQWKNKFPTYNNNLFSFEKQSKEEILKGMVQSENVHLGLMVFSFIPILLGKYFGHYFIMIILAIVLALLHVPFVLIQRYNIPRILNSRFDEKLD